MKRVFLVAVAALALAGCKINDDSASTLPGAGGTGTEAEARTFLEGFLKADTNKHALSQRLEPRADDYDAVFEDASVEKARTWYQHAWSTHKLTIQGTKEQTELQVFHMTTEDLKANADSAKQFPMSYSRVANALKPGLTIYGFRFVKPGETAGTSFDGLIFVNGHWAFFPKPFHALR
ncbi:MAG: lipoprotein [Deltaproteobacteria bacterium]|nr:lipoprotein [Deltaproteobacteria bacterium]